MKDKIKFFTHGVKITYSDDLLKVVKFFKEKIGLELEITVPEETKVHLKDSAPQLYLPYDQKKESSILMYMFDRYQEKQANSSCFSFSKTLQVIEISTAEHDDKVDYTWKAICHEFLHSCFKRLRIMGIDLDDPMDAMVVNGVLMPYYKNDDPYALDGNFAEAFKRLAPYWGKLYPQSRKYKWISDKEVEKYQVVDALWRIADRIRDISGVKLIPTSGGRTVEENKKVGGQPNSAHLRGLALDFKVIGSEENTKVLHAIDVVRQDTPFFLEIAVGHYHIDIDSSIHSLTKTIISSDD